MTRIGPHSLLSLPYNVVPTNLALGSTPCFYGILHSSILLHHGRSNKSGVIINRANNN
jgi:hypothetical protein